MDSTESPPIISRGKIDLLSFLLNKIIGKKESLHSHSQDSRLLRNWNSDSHSLFPFLCTSLLCLEPVALSLPRDFGLRILPKILVRSPWKQYWMPQNPYWSWFRLAGAGYKVRARLLSTQSKRWERLKAIASKPGRSGPSRRQLPIEFWLGRGFPLNPYLKGKMIVYFREALKPKEIKIFPSHNEIKKRCFLGHVEHGLALCHSYKRSPIQDWKKCYMRT